MGQQGLKGDDWQWRLMCHKRLGHRREFLTTLKDTQSYFGITRLITCASRRYSEELFKMCVSGNGQMWLQTTISWLHGWNSSWGGTGQRGQTNAWGIIPFFWMIQTSGRNSVSHCPISSRSCKSWWKRKPLTKGGRGWKERLNPRAMKCWVRRSQPQGGISTETD